MKVIVRAKAADDLAAIYAWISKDSVDAAATMVLKIRHHISVLEMPECRFIGRLGRDEGTHELVEGSYIIVYVVNERKKTISVISIIHGSRQR